MHNRLGFIRNHIYRFSTTDQTEKSKLIQKYGNILGPIYWRTSSNEFRDTFQVKRYVEAHAWRCLHLWMLDYRLRVGQVSWSEMTYTWIIRIYLGYLVKRHNEKAVFEYVDRFNNEIYFEHRRMQRTLFWSLDDYFEYDFKQKSMEQIIVEDLGVAKWQEAQKYLLNELNKLKKMKLKQIWRMNWL